MYICSFPIMYVGKCIIEQNIMLGETYLAGQKWPVTSQVVYTLFIETAATTDQFTAVSLVLIYYFKNIFLYPAIYR